MLMRLLRPLPALAGVAIMFVTLDISAAERPDSFADQAEALSPAVLISRVTNMIATPASAGSGRSNRISMDSDLL